MKDIWNRLEYYIDLVVVLVVKEFKIRYKNSMLGYFWSIANPLALSLIFYFAFKIIMRVPIKDYTLFLITGMFAWQWIANAVKTSVYAFLGNSSLIKKVNFPRYMLPVAVVLTEGIHFCLAIPIILIFVFVYNRVPSVSLLYGVPLMFILQFGAILGVALMVASVNLFFRDLERLVDIFLMFVFYLTPIFYSIDMIPEPYKSYLMFNPAMFFIDAWRRLFMDGTVYPSVIGWSALYSVVLLLIGAYIYNRLRWRFAEVL